MKRIITYGTFDLLHYGHINLLKRAKALGDYLVVAISTDEFNWNEKQKKCYFTYEQRKALVEAIRYVDLVIPEESWEQKKTDVHEYHIDAFVIGDDWQGKFDFLKDEGCEVVYLPRTPEISTTQIKQDLNGEIKQQVNEMDATDQLKLIHLLEMKIASEVKRICEKHDIKYFLTAGTLLGAVRHGGFIPWDEDMDIGMLREDYERFVKACKTDLGDEFFLQTWDTDSDYPFSFGKIRLNGTHFVEGFSEEGEMHDGIFVDIFPFDNVPDDFNARKKQARRYYLCKRLLWIKKGCGKNLKEESSKQAMRYYAFWVFSHLFRYDSIKSYFKKVQTKYNGQTTQKVVADGSYSYEKESLERKWVENLEPVKFETEEFLSFKYRIEYLTYFYGDYKRLPPNEERNRHMLRRVDFGSYEKELDLMAQEISVPSTDEMTLREVGGGVQSNIPHSVATVHQCYDWRVAA